MLCISKISLAYQLYFCVKSIKMWRLHLLILSKNSTVINALFLPDIFIDHFALDFFFVAQIKPNFVDKINVIKHNLNIASACNNDRKTTGLLRAKKNATSKIALRF